MDYKEFSAKVKAKYPQYSDMNDEELARKMVAKFPKEYADVTFDAPAPVKPQSTGVGEFVYKHTQNPTLAIGAESVGRAVSNIPQSAGNFVGGIVQAGMHPIQTAQGLVRLAAGGIEKATGIGGESVATFDQFANAMRGRYGSVGAIKNTFETDPVGFAADASTVLGGAGSAMKNIGMASKLGPIAKAGEIATMASGAIDPVSTATGLAKVVGGKMVPSSIAPRLYQSAAKISTSLAPEEKIARITTGLKEGIPVSNKGFDAIGREIDKINGQIGQTIQQSAARGTKVPTDVIASRVDQLKPFFENTINPKEYIDALDNMKQEFIAAHGAEIPIDKAQKIKQNTYTLLRKAYGEMKSVNVEGQKAIARGIKEEIAQRYPEINSLNAREAKLIGLEESIGRAVGRIDNRDLIGIGTPVAGAAGAALIGEKTGGVMIGMLKTVLDNPEVKSKIAIALDRAHKARMSELLRPTRTAKVGSVLNATGTLNNPRP